MRPPLLLLHGFPLDARMWRFVVECFRDERAVIAPNASDLLGLPHGSPSMERMADGALSALEAVAPGTRAIVAGLSIGGYVALEFAHRHPERVAALVLSDTRATADTPDGRAARDAMIREVRERGVIRGTRPTRVKLLAPDAADDVSAAVDAIIADQDEDTVIACIAAMRDRRDNTATLESLAVPVLVVRGAEDAIIPADVAEGMARAARHGQLATIERAGHVPPLEAPAAFNAALVKFLRDLIA
jgi:pimeloyl-ACP methyl ester carboxylesterase